MKLIVCYLISLCYNMKKLSDFIWILKGVLYSEFCNISDKKHGQYCNICYIIKNNKIRESKYYRLE